MKTEGVVKAVTVQTNPKEKVRKSLHPLQPAATDKENLVGAGRQLRSSGVYKETIKNEMSAKMKDDNKKTEKDVVLTTISTKKVDNETKTKSKKGSNNKKTGKAFKNISTQTETIITEEDLTSSVGPSEDYWKIVAERRRIALKDALDENEILHDRVQTYKEMLEESRALVEVLKEMIGEDQNSINHSLDDSRL